MLRIALHIALDILHSSYKNSESAVKAIHLEIEKSYVNRIMKNLTKVFARIINQYRFIFQVVFSVRFEQPDEDDQAIDENELYINLNMDNK